MSKLARLTIVLGIIGIFPFGTAASAFELLSEMQGKAYYKADDGTIITHEIDSTATEPVFLYNDKENRVMYYRVSDGRILEARIFGGNLSNAPDYKWWYGCTPTSAGMMMGYYDINGYGGLTYDDLVPGGTAELNTFPAGTYIANDIIASSGHIADYYSSYGSTSDPCGGACPNHTLNSLADFMCTSDYLHCGNSDGGTLSYNWNSGDRFTHNDAVTYGVTQDSGMYGIGEYVQYTGYGYVNNSLYNQQVDTSLASYFSWTDYTNEIDSGRPALIHVTGHTMFAYGYSGTDTVYIHDTWNSGVHTMPWGGSYSGLDHQGMTCFQPSGGDTPPPSTIFYVVETDPSDDCGGNSPCYNTTIQDAIDAATVPGTEVRIAGGTYNQNVTIDNDVLVTPGWDGDFTTAYPSGGPTVIAGTLS